jgi:hypothetical protein
MGWASGGRFLRHPHPDSFRETTPDGALPPESPFFLRQAGVEDLDDFGWND